ncbi:Facilitated trehalose transporter Tret1-2 [Chionoecetes opilio]|uniref:Facilitated trehalose transporter Tret1-2 n=1 Tax=Chionoecetes opilio TaxID=41210 RepID=A0A8J4Y665_CHIOP|nr:Facilitated trehalose transporter Tret1-2 [Chionoecetes opilio]
MIVLRKLRGPHADLHSEIETIEMKNSCRAGGWQKLLSWYMAKRVATIVMLFAFQQFCGNYVFIVHTARILRKMGIPWDADRSTIIVAAVRIVGTLVSISIVDRVGRRTCLIASHAITLASLTTLGIFVYLAEAAPPENTIFSRLAWVPLFCLVLVMFGLHVGAHPVPFVLAAEYFPTSVRGQTFSVCYSSGMLFGFLVLQFYSPMLAALTQPGLYWFYAAVSTLAVAFTFIFVEETKGKNIG